MLIIQLQKEVLLERLMRRLISTVSEPDAVDIANAYLDLTELCNLSIKLDRLDRGDGSDE